jgi:uncharacterized membrane protein
MLEQNKRSFIKAVTWRITGTVDTFVISFFITGKLSYATAISITEIATKIFLYYMHERIWNIISWGKGNYLKEKPNKDMNNITTT